MHRWASNRKQQEQIAGLQKEVETLRQAGCGEQAVQEDAALLSQLEELENSVEELRRLNEETTTSISMQYDARAALENELGSEVIELIGEETSALTTALSAIITICELL